jgi:hypothetical protein
MDKKLFGFYTGYKNAVSQPTRLVDRDLLCDFIILSVANTKDNTQDTEIVRDIEGEFFGSREEIYWGFENVCAHQLFPMQTTFLIPVKNARDISVRNSQNKGQSTRVSFSCFRYKKNED